MLFFLSFFSDIITKLLRVTTNNKVDNYNKLFSSWTFRKKAYDYELYFSIFKLLWFYYQQFVSKIEKNI